MYFEKYHGTGNDFILFSHEPKNPSDLAKAVCDRHFGIGADGILYPSKSSIADLKMNYYNSDGSIAKMCGNGLRCFTKFAKSQGIVDKNHFYVETLAGILEVTIHENEEVTIDLGEPVTKLNSEFITHHVDFKKGYTFNLSGNQIKGYLLSTGTMHTIVYLNDHQDLSLKEIASRIQKDSIFVDQSNINFVTVNKDGIDVKTYERGAGWTLSCGTGVAAAAYTSYHLGLTKEIVRVTVPGGKLLVQIKDNKILLTGPAQKIFHGEYNESI